MPGPRRVEKRRSDRVAMALPVRVKGTDLTGADFEEFTRTVEISLNGAKFSLKRLLAANQKIEILNVRQGGQGPFRVVGQVSSPDSPGIFWGAECVGLSPSFWGIHSPPPCRKRERRQPEYYWRAPNAGARPSVISPILRPKFSILPHASFVSATHASDGRSGKGGLPRRKGPFPRLPLRVPAPTCENIAACRFK